MMHHSTSQLVDAHLLLSIEAQDVNSSICCNELLHVINAFDSDFTLTDHWVVIGVGGDQKTLQELRLVASHQLIEDVVAPLSRQLEGYTRLLQQICFNIS